MRDPGFSSLFGITTDCSKMEGQAEGMWPLEGFFILTVCYRYSTQDTGTRPEPHFIRGYKGVPCWRTTSDHMRFIIIPRNLTNQWEPDPFCSHTSVIAE